MANNNNSTDIISTLLTDSSGDINSVGKSQIKSLLKTTMNDIKNFQKYAEEDKKEIKLLKIENSKLSQKIQVLYEENKALKGVAKLPLNDEMARQVAKKELAMERYKKKKFGDNSEKNSIKRFKKNVQSDSEESDDSEYERRVKKEKKRQVKKKKNTDMRKSVNVAIVIPTVKATPIVKKSR